MPTRKIIDRALEIAVGFEKVKDKKSADYWFNLAVKAEEKMKEKEGKDVHNIGGVTTYG